MSQTEVQLIKDAVIVNADVSNSAAIDVSKISGAMPTAGGTFTDDVTFTGASANIVFDKSDNALEFVDNAKATFGTSGDLQVFHDGNSKIQNVNNSCDFRLISNSIELKSQSGDEFFQKCTVDGAVELYHDNGKVFTTESNGVQVLANEGLSAFLRIYADQGDDNADLYWLKTEQDGTGFYIQNNVSGSTETNFRTVGNGATELFHDNSKKLETLSDGVNVTGTLKVNGSAFSGGIASVVEDTSPQLGGHLDSNGFNVAISTGEKLTFAASSGAGPEIYNAGSSSRDLRINIDNDHKYTLHQNGILYQEGANSSNGGAYTSPQPSYPVRVWLSFNDEDNITNGVGGVSSVTDTGTGTFTINFGTSFPDDNYAFTATSGGQSGSRGDDTCITHGTTNPGTGSVSIRTRKFTDNNFTNSESAMFIFVR